MKKKDFKSQVTVHLPAWNESNPYQELLAGGLAEFGWKTEFRNYPKTAFAFNKIVNNEKHVRVLHVHWIAPYIERFFWTKSKPITLLKLTILALDIILCRVRGRKIVWTVHNLVSHESQNRDLEIKIRKIFASFANHIIFHSEEARKHFENQIVFVSSRKVSIVPHGNYVNWYKDNEDILRRISNELGLNGKRVVLFFGAIRSYKGIPELLTAFTNSKKEDVILLIAGKSYDNELKEKLELAAKQDRRICLKLGFIEESEVDPIHRLGDLVAIPFRDTLTSGSVLLAMSLEKPIALPRSAEVLGYRDSDGIIFYENEKHLTKIIENIESLDLEEMGRRNLEAALNNSWHGIGRKTTEIYGRA